MDSVIKSRNKLLFAESNSNDIPEIVYISNSESCGSDRSFFAVTGLNSGNFIYSSVLVYKDGSVKLFVSTLEEEEAILSKLPYIVMDVKRSNLFLELKKYSKVGVNFSSLPLREAEIFKKKDIRICDVSSSVLDLRAIKTEKEIISLKKACIIANDTAKEIPLFLKEGITELELATLIDFSMRKKGAEGSAFETIAAFGENSAIPHAHPSSRKLKQGDLVLCDFGCIKNKMSSDITRVFCFGKAEQWQKDLYNKINNIRKKAIREISFKKNGKDLNTMAIKSVEEYFKEKKYKGGMNHSLGHSLGYYTHDGKGLGLKDYIIPSSFAVTIEPAGYIPGLGGVRLEDDIIVYKDSVEILTGEPADNLIEV